MTYFLRVMVFVGPVIAFIITKRICIGLQRADAERLLHGSESAIIVRDPSGGYSEAHMPIDQEEAYTLTQHVEPLPLAPVTEQGDLTDKELKAEQRRRKATRFWYLDALRKPTRAELEAAAHHDDDHGDGNGHGEIGTATGTATGTAPRRSGPARAPDAPRTDRRAVSDASRLRAGRARRR